MYGVICDRRAAGSKVKGEFITCSVWLKDGGNRAGGGRDDHVKIFWGDVMGVMDRFKNENIRQTARVRRLGDELRESRLRWFGERTSWQEKRGNTKDF